MAHSDAFLAIVNEAKSRIKEASISQVQAWQAASDPFIFIDTREDSEWERGGLPGAIHIGKGVIERDIEQHIADKNTKIVLYCGGGFRSALAADSLQKMGYNNTYSMDGGYRGWV